MTLTLVLFVPFPLIWESIIPYTVIHLLHPRADGKSDTSTREKKIPSEYEGNR
ncbi:hypothetical protein BaRGS_00006065, partial [Batillaria attramentaria]